MKIAIVYENSSDIQEIKEILSSLNIFKTIDCYNNGLDFLYYASKYNYVCLDTEMEHLDGIKISKILTNSKIKIIFVTNHTERMIDAFGINVAKFILKKDMDTDLKIFFLEEYRKTNKFIDIQINKKNTTISLNDIVYIESSLGDLKFVLNDKSVLLIKCKTLKSIIYKLDETFYQINRNTIVNLKYITEFHNNNVKIIDECKKISRRKINGLKYELVKNGLIKESD